MISTFSSVLLFAAAIWGSYALAGFYGVALSASAMMATTAMQLAIDAFVMSCAELGWIVPILAYMAIALLLAHIAFRTLTL